MEYGISGVRTGCIGNSGLALVLTITIGLYMSDKYQKNLKF